MPGLLLFALAALLLTGGTAAAASTVTTNKKRWARVFREAADRLVSYYYNGGRKPAAIGRFQEILRIPKTGVVDTRTRARVFEILGPVSWTPEEALESDNAKRKRERDARRKEREAREREARRKEREARELEARREAREREARRKEREAREREARERGQAIPGTRQTRTDITLRESRPLPYRTAPSYFSMAPRDTTPAPPAEPEKPAWTPTVDPVKAAEVLRHYTRDGGNQGSVDHPDAVVRYAQANMGQVPVDGIVGPETRDRALALGKPLYRRLSMKPGGINQKPYLEELGAA